MILLSLKVNKHLAVFDGQKINFVVSYICFGFFFFLYDTCTCWTSDESLIYFFLSLFS
jgi:uncharacterized membrane protein SirB2